MTINATAATLLAMYVAAPNAAAPTRRSSPAPSRTTSSRSTSRAAPTSTPVAPAMRSPPTSSPGPASNVPRVEHHLHLRLPHARSRLDRRAGVAFTLANGRAYVDAALDAGLDIDSFAPRLSFFFNAHSNLLRRGRQVSRRPPHLGPLDARALTTPPIPRSWMLRFHTQTAGSTLTAQQPENNIVRTTSRRSPPSSAARKACTPTASTKPSPCPPSRPRASPCAPSRSSPTRRQARSGNLAGRAPCSRRHRPNGRKSDAENSRSRGSQRHRRRNFRRHAQGLWGVQGSGRDLGANMFTYLAKLKRLGCGIAGAVILTTGLCLSRAAIGFSYRNWFGGLVFGPIAVVLGAVALFGSIFNWRKIWDTQPDQPQRNRR
jgi:hypothetical protein